MERVQVEEVPGRGQKTGLIGVDLREQSWETEVRDASLDTQILAHLKGTDNRLTLTGLE